MRPLENESIPRSKTMTQTAEGPKEQKNGLKKRKVGVAISHFLAAFLPVSSPVLGRFQLPDRRGGEAVLGPCSPFPVRLCLCCLANPRCEPGRHLAVVCEPEQATRWWLRELFFVYGGAGGLFVSPLTPWFRHVFLFFFLNHVVSHKAGYLRRKLDLRDRSLSSLIFFFFNLRIVS